MFFKRGVQHESPCALHHSLSIVQTGRRSSDVYLLCSFADGVRAASINPTAGTSSAWRLLLVTRFAYPFLLYRYSLFKSRLINWRGEFSSNKHNGAGSCNNVTMSSGHRRRRRLFLTADQHLKQSSGASYSELHKT